MIFYFVVTNTWFHFFIHSKIEFWSSFSLLRTLNLIHSPTPKLNIYFSISTFRTLDFILSTDARLNIDLPLRHYEHLTSFFHLFLDWTLIFSFILRTIDFILSFAPRLDINLLCRCYEHMIWFIHSLQN